MLHLSIIVCLGLGRDLYILLLLWLLVNSRVVKILIERCLGVELLLRRVL